VIKILSGVIKILLKSPKRVAVVVILLFAAVYLLLTRNANKSSESTLQTAQVEKGTIVSSVSASGTVLTSYTSSVTTQASGVVKKIYVKEGDSVVKGQKIAEIELDLDGAQQSAQAYASYIGAVNSVKSAKNNLRSAQAALDNVYDQIQGHDTDETFAMRETRTRAEVAKDNAYNSVQNAQASLASATFNYRLSSPSVTAPTSGTISSMAIAEGMTLTTQTLSSGTRTGQRVASISTSGNSLVSVNVSEIDVPSVKDGQKATVTFDSIPDKTFSGEVVAIDREGNTTSNVTNYPAIISLDSGSNEILSNMAATANIIVEVKNDVLTVPTSAVQVSGGQSVVRVIKDGQEQSVNVETGISSDTQVEIISGLSEGETVVVGSLTQTTDSSGRSVFSTGFGGARFIGR
jgi:macrolide-specific efflux system membrane fusion protein